MPVRAIRGAITIDGDTPEQVHDQTIRLLKAIMKRNQLADIDLISLTFSTTADIRSLAPAAAAREMGMTDVPLLCLAEMPVDGALERCIRVMMHVDTDRARSEVTHCFLGAASTLRPDLSEAEVD